MMLWIKDIFMSAHDSVVVAGSHAGDHCQTAEGNTYPRHCPFTGALRFEQCVEVAAKSRDGAHVHFPR
jgi:coenzyme F420-reducing hydrogenase delta subunit